MNISYAPYRILLPKVNTKWPVDGPERVVSVLLLLKVPLELSALPQFELMVLL